MKIYKKTILPIILLICFVAALGTGITLKEVFADGVGSETGLGDPGSKLYTTQLLYEVNEKGLLGFYEGTLSGLTFQGSELAMLWMYNGVGRFHEGDLSDAGLQCVIGFGLVNDSPTTALFYNMACYDHTNGVWVMADPTDPTSIYQLRIINVVTDDLSDLGGL